MKDIGEFFKENIEGYQTPLPDDLWGKIEQAPEIRRYNFWQRYKRAFVYSVASVVLVAVIATVAYLLDNREVNNLPGKDDATINREQAYPLPDSSRRAVNNDKALAVDESLLLLSIPEKPLPKQEKADKKVLREELWVVDSGSEETVPLEEEILEMEELPVEEPRTRKDQDKTTIYMPPEQHADTVEEGIVIPEEEENSREESPTLFIPAAFTPNNDGLNDVFKPYSAVELFDFEMTIFDRSGKLIYRTHDFQSGWDGRSNGQVLPSGAYVYMLVYKDQLGKREMKKGSVMLVR